jgi:hypothetical protein
VKHGKALAKIRGSVDCNLSETVPMLRASNVAYTYSIACSYTPAEQAGGFLIRENVA